jgi:hypothetical protein
MRHLTRTSVLAGVVALSLIACGPLRRGDTPDAVVIFRNESLEQADVYAVRSGGSQIRIGTVFPGRRELLRVSSTISSAGASISIAARILASSQRPTTGPLTLSPGDTVEVTLPASLNTLTLLPMRQP